MRLVDAPGDEPAPADANAPMLIDLEKEAAGAIYTSQVCILGAGIAGLVLAQKLASRGFVVHLLEAGGLDLEERSQRLYQAEIAGDDHAGTRAGRFRVFGGSSTRWGGQLLPYTGDIFSPQPGMPSHAWPIAADAIEQYYPEVLKVMGTDGLPFDESLLPVLGRPGVDFGSNIALRFSQWAPFRRRNLAHSLGRESIAHPGLTVFLHANAMSVDPGPDASRIGSATVKNYAGSTFTFRAQQFVVCLGTIESSRLLLASGVGNGFDQVGRYFHDHIGLRVARIEGQARRQLIERLGPMYVKGTLHTCKLEASARLRVQKNLPAIMAHIVIEEPEDSGVGAVRGLLRSLQEGDLRRAAAKNLVPMLAGLGDIARLAWQSRVHQRRAISRRAKLWLKIDLEQVARPDDRIRLAETRDALGQRRVIVDWRIAPESYTAAQTYAEIVRAELERVGITGLSWETDRSMADTFHAMGGLRMGIDPSDSVVDTNLKVHGVENLHVAGCAVFPAGGSSNPTFTMMALTLRPADELATRWGR
jgi:choline dehydrogenase-like flavoprotein